MKFQCTEYERTGSMYEAVFTDGSGDEYEFSKVN